LKLRSSSVDNKVTLSYTDNEDGKPYDFQIDLDDVKLITPDPKRELSLVKITEKSGIVMHYPAASLYEDTEFLNLDKDYLFELIVRCIDQICFEDEVYDANSYSINELKEFIESLDIKTFDQIQKFLLSTPKLEYTIKYKNSLGNDRTIVLSSLNDFFMWR
jgi:hypothetical protein